MKKFNFWAIAISFLFATMQASAQFLSFDKIEFDYGVIPTTVENDRAIFSCTNRGEEPIVIKKIETSSSAIKCEVSRDTLKKGARAAINVTLNPKKLSSIFTEHIDVYTNDKMLGKVTLTLKGTAKDIDSTIMDMYPGVYDLVRLTKINISLGTINYPDVVVDTVVVYNPQDSAVSLVFPNVPSFMKVQMYPEVIQPNSTALMVISYDSKERKEWGPVYDKLYMGFQGKKVNYKMKLSISGNITEDFSNLTEEELKKAPKIVFKSDVFNFDTVKKGDPVSCQFHFENQGESTLEIRKIKTSCGCTAGSMDKMSYAKGEDGVVNVTLNTRNKYGHVRQTITIISNDPVNTESRVFIDGYVVDPNE